MRVTSELGSEGHALVSTEFAAAVQLQCNAELRGDRQGALNGFSFAVAVGRDRALLSAELASAPVGV